MDRRSAIKLLTATYGVSASGLVLIRSAAAAQSHAAGDYKPKFFNRDEYRMVDQLAELIIPSDERSPGAHEAGVAAYIDSLLAAGDAAKAAGWKEGLRAVDSVARQKFQASFVQCHEEQQDTVVAALAANEQKPASPAERFFVLLKQTVIAGYYTSEVGIRRELGYRGNVALSEFPGCTHDSHQREPERQSPVGE